MQTSGLQTITSCCFSSEKCIIQVCTKFQVHKQIMAAEKMWQKSYCVYPPDIIQTSLLDRLQKKSFEQNDCFYVASVLQWRVGKLPMDNFPSLLVCKITFKQIVRMLFQCFLKAQEKHCDNLFEHTFMDLRHFCTLG